MEVSHQVWRDDRRHRPREGQVVNAAELATIGLETELETRTAQLSQVDRAQRGSAAHHRDFRAVPGEGGAGSRRIREDKRHMAVRRKTSIVPARRSDRAGAIPQLQATIRLSQKAEFAGTIPNDREKVTRQMAQARSEEHTSEL